MQQFWDERFSAGAFAYGTEPNAFLKKQLENLPAGNALFPCEGEGRNAVYTASLGWEVEAFDFSISGRNKALMLANRQDVPLHYGISKAEDAQYPNESFDLIALIFAHFPPTERRLLHQKCIAWLKPGGRIILESFRPEQLEMKRSSGGPKVPEMLYTREMLSEDFAGLEIEILETPSVFLDEGEFHHGDAEVIRFVGIKSHV